MAFNRRILADFLEAKAERRLVILALLGARKVLSFELASRSPVPSVRRKLFLTSAAYSSAKTVQRPDPQMHRTTLVSKSFSSAMLWGDETRTDPEPT